MDSQNDTKPQASPIKVVLTMPDQILQGQPCEIKVDIKNVSANRVMVNKRLSVGYQKSLSRELFISICHEGSSENIAEQKVLYERKFSPASDFVWLQPQQQTSTHFNLFDWYEIKAAGTYTLLICYQADEELAFKPEELCKGVFCSEEKKLTIIAE